MVVCRAPSGGGSSGVTSGEAAAIGICSAVGGALLAAAVMYFVFKRKAKYAPHVDEGTVQQHNPSSSLLVLHCQIAQFPMKFAVHLIMR